MAEIVFTRAGFWRGVRFSLPIIPGVFPFGLVVGIVAASHGLSWAEALLMSALNFAGSAQLVVLDLWREPAPILAATLATLAVNLRLAPMGAAMAPWFNHLRGWRLWMSLALLVDHSFAAALPEMRRGGRDAAFLFGISVALWMQWVTATATGFALAGVLHLPLDNPVLFAGLGALLALLVPLWRGRGDLLPWAVAGGIAISAHLLGLGAPWPVLAGGFGGALAGALRDRQRGLILPGAGRAS